MRIDGKKPCAYTFHAVVFGQKHWDLFKKVTLRSLHQRRNLAAIQENDCEFLIYTTGDPGPLVLDLPTRNHQVIGFTEQIDLHTCLIQALRYSIAHCLSKGRTLVTSPPDTFFGDGSIETLFNINRLTNSQLCIAAPHVRVNTDGFLARLATESGPISNRRLARMALDTLHASWTNCRLSNETDPTKSYVNGTMLIELGNGNFLIQSNLPTYWIANFNETDAIFYNRAYFIASWDWVWPNKVYQDGRHRIIGSSNQFFAAEVTDPRANLGFDLGSASENIHGFAFNMPVNAVNKTFYFDLDVGADVDAAAPQPA